MAPLVLTTHPHQLPLAIAYNRNITPHTIRNQPAPYRHRPTLTKTQVILLTPTLVTMPLNHNLTPTNIPQTPTQHLHRIRSQLSLVVVKVHRPPSHYRNINLHSRLNNLRTDRIHHRIPRYIRLVINPNTLLRAEYQGEKGKEEYINIGGGLSLGWPYPPCPHSAWALCLPAVLVLS